MKTKFFTLLSFAVLSLPSGQACEWASTQFLEDALVPLIAIDDHIEGPNSYRCLESPARYDEAKEARLLNDIKDDVIAALNDKIEETQQLDLPSLRTEHQALRLFLGLQNVEVMTQLQIHEDDLAIEFEIRPTSTRLHHSGLESTLPPLTEDETLMITNALSSFQQEAHAEISTSLREQHRELLNLGFNPLVPLTSNLGEMKDLKEQRLRQISSTGLRQLLAQSPHLLFINSTSPTEEEVQEGLNTYREALRAERDHLVSLSLPPIDSSTLPLIFYSQSASKFIAENEDNCGLYNALLERVQANERFRTLSTLGLGVAAAGGCIAAGLFSGGLLGIGCMALAGLEVGVAGSALYHTNLERQSLQAMRLLSGDMELLDLRRREANLFLMSAGLAPLGAISGSIPAGIRWSYRGSSATQRQDLSQHYVTMGHLRRLMNQDQNSAISSIVNGETAVLYTRNTVGRTPHEAVYRDGQVFRPASFSITPPNGQGSYTVIRGLRIYDHRASGPAPSFEELIDQGYEGILRTSNSPLANSPVEVILFRSQEIDNLRPMPLP